MFYLLFKMVGVRLLSPFGSGVAVTIIKMYHLRVTWTACVENKSEFQITTCHWETVCDNITIALHVVNLLCTEISRLYIWKVKSIKI